MNNTSPELVFFLVAIIAAGAWLLGRRSALRSRAPLRREDDSAADLARDLAVAQHVSDLTLIADDGGVQVQLELGELFRRRGELDRATAIHRRLGDHREPAVRDRARFELACDFTAAGLIDRAEQLLQELAGVPSWRERALDQLVRLYEQQGDWSNALRTFNELPPRQQHERRAIAAHYLCELAEDALAQGDHSRTILLLRQARGRQSDCARATLLEARVADLEARPAAALDGYLAAAAAAPQLLLELVPRIAGVELRAGRLGALAAMLSEFERAGRISTRQLALLPALTDEPLSQRRGADAAARYQCNVCGFHSVSWYWRCPSCRSWESLSPGILRPNTDENQGTEHQPGDR